MNILTEYEKIKLKKSILIDNLNTKDAILKAETKRANALTETRLLISEVAKAAQENLKTQIEELVTSCLQSVFQNRDFQFKLNFQIKRNKMECVPTVIEGTREMSPEHEMGGGVLDIISFAMRIIMWNMQHNRTRPFLMLDEPLRFCGNLIGHGCEMIKQISKGLGTQILIITHSDELINIADKSWQIKHVLGKSVVSEDAR
jgi:DNA repair exonuclease SbcCD ATPase subunit